MKTIYLIHFSRPFKHARHYMGQTGDLAARLSRHKAGRGASLLAAAVSAGIRLHVVRKWTGSKATAKNEQRLKRTWKNSDLCPRCSGTAARNRGNL